ncbi:MAG: RdgB/HAM1 family non-canonical purine NTP pyrophosphatase [Chitinophagaceae bacterium]|nr:RdgB/HAM1 family non-canonical purine NTP pyrophosphatase [Chitinophagaceae bacterium]
MPTTLIFATNNAHKVEEIQAVIGDAIEVISLSAAGIDIDIPEPHATLEENAREKSQTIYRLTGLPCFSEDTGLEVDALNGEPGVKSARYAGEHRDFSANIEKVLAGLEGKENRGARFRTVISIIWDGIEHQFEGICEGEILRERRGEKGFGYDPIFMADGETRSFAEMTTQEKTAISHRTKAASELVKFLKNNTNNGIHA